MLYLARWGWAAVGTLSQAPQAQLWEGCAPEMGKQTRFAYTPDTQQYATSCMRTPGDEAAHSSIN